MIKQYLNIYNELKTIAFYLPQFHEVEENSKWWGEGYTDWIAVKKAVPLFDDHKQPRVPLNSYYYDLLDKDVLLWQAGLMKKYGIDGLCFYHYYFKNGKKILEKPAENLLKWTDIDMPFCLAWANGSWGRTWSNSWAWNELEETEEDPNDSGILLDQKYGRESAWREHFEYLLPFFRDSRYICFEDKPVFIFHSATGIPCLTPMLHYWRILAKDAGLKGLYFIGMNARDISVSKELDAIMFNTPHQAWDLKSAEMVEGLCFPSFETMWGNTLEYSPLEGQKVYYEGCGDYDDTPRRGRGSGIVLADYSVNKLKHYMEELYLKSYASDNIFIFFNAWNEWGEGMYLEPDEAEGYSRLEAIRDAKEGARQKILEFGEAAYAKYKYMISTNEMTHNEDIRYERIKTRVRCLSGLLDCLEENRNIAALLIDNDINTVAIYGMGDVGKHLTRELESKGIIIEYIIDKNPNIQLPYPRYSIEDDLPVVDAILVTPILDFDTIHESIINRMNVKILSVLELIYEAE